MKEVVLHRNMVTERLLAITAMIIHDEPKTRTNGMGVVYRWQSVLGSVPLQLGFEDVNLSHPLSNPKFVVNKAVLSLPTEEMTLSINRNLAGPVRPLTDDPYAQEFLDAFEAYPRHNHTVCLAK